MTAHGTLWHMMDAIWDPSRTPGCARCGESEYSPNVEAFEVSGEIVCDLCAEAILEEAA